MDEEMARDDKVFIMGEEVAEYQVRRRRRAVVQAGHSCHKMLFFKAQHWGASLCLAGQRPVSVLRGDFRRSLQQH